MEHKIKCPVCTGHRDDPCFINDSNWKGICHRCKTTFKGDLARKVLFEAKNIHRVPNLSLQAPELVDAWGNREAREFLYSRGVDEDMLPSIEFSESERRIYFRIWGVSEEFPRSYHRRVVYKQREGIPKWSVMPGTHKKYYLYGGVKPGAKQVCLVEGIWDQLKIGENCIALLGTSLSLPQLCYFKLLSPKPEINLFLDKNDEAGEKAEKDLHGVFEYHGFNVRVIDADREPGNYYTGHPVLKRVQEMLR